MAYDQTLLRQLATCRLDEANILAQAGEFSGAYYLAGYALECLLKSLIAARFRANEIPDRSLVNNVYTYDLAALIRLAELDAVLEARIEADVAFQARWSVAKRWSEQSRYKIWDEADASAMLDAVCGTDAENGLFQWLTGHLSIAN